MPVLASDFPTRNFGLPSLPMFSARVNWWEIYCSKPEFATIPQYSSVCSADPSPAFDSTASTGPVFPGKVCPFPDLGAT